MPNAITEIAYSIAELANAEVPQIATPDDINLERLAKALGKSSVDELVFDTRPIGKVTESRNKRAYSEESVLSLVEQVKSKRPEGRWGHLSESQAASLYEPPAVRWVNAVYQESNQTGYGKLIALTPEAERHILSAKELNAKIGTSIYAHNPTFESTTNKVKDYDLVTIDLANAERVGIYDMNSVPNVSREMDESNSGENLMSQNANNADTNKENNGAGAGAVTETADVKGIRAIVTVQETELNALRPIKELYGTVAELLGVPDDGVISAVRTMREQVASLSRENVALLESTIDTEIAAVVKPEMPRPFVREQVVLAKPTTREEVKTAVAKAVEIAHIKALIAKAVELESGGKLNTSNGGVAENNTNDTVVFE